MDNKKKKNWRAFAIGILAGVILYHLLFNVIIPNLF